MRGYFWISYFMISLLIAGLLGYLIAICSCNTSIVTGMLYCLICYGLLAVSAVFHMYKIAPIKVVYAIILAIGFGAVGGMVVWFLESVAPKKLIKTITPNYFMEWFVSCCFVGVSVALGILFTKNVKHRLMVTKNKNH